MPDIPDNELASLRGELRKKGLPSKTRIKTVVGRSERYNFVGYGSECVIVGNKKNPDVVVAFTYRDMEPRKAREVFYTHRILQNLFPHNFPKFHAAWAVKDERSFSGTFRERIEGTHASGRNIGPTVAELDEDANFPFSRVEEVVEKLELPVAFDQASRNFMLAADGGMYYIDRAILKRGMQDKDDHKMSWKEDEIIDYMQKQNYSEKEIEKVVVSITRIRALDQE